MRTFFATALAASVTAISQLDSDFMAFIAQYGRNYKDLNEYAFRLEQFERVRTEILAHNETESTY